MGPLTGTRIIEFTGIGPGPFAGMMLADMGAEILRIDRPNEARRVDPAKDITARGRKSIAVDLKSEGASETVLRLIEKADAIFEGYRPGVMERLGLGPEVCLARNPRLVYGRMTGWGQDGTLAHSAGHDINYISLSGALWSIGEKDRKPVPPLNLLGDFGGGGMMLAFGIVCGLLKARQTGFGDVVDAAITDGTTALMAPIYAQVINDLWANERQSNRLDGGAPYYCTYECKDGKWISFGALEPQFFNLALELLQLPAEDFEDRLNPAMWAAHKAVFARTFYTRTRDEWAKIFEGTDACIAPILDLEEAANHAHNQSRNTFVKEHGYVQPAPAPRFKDAVVTMPCRPPLPGEHNASALCDWGFADGEISELRKGGVLVG